MYSAVAMQQTVAEPTALEIVLTFLAGLSVTQYAITAIVVLVVVMFALHLFAPAVAKRIEQPVVDSAHDFGETTIMLAKKLSGKDKK